MLVEEALNEGAALLNEVVADGRILEELGHHSPYHWTWLPYRWHYRAWWRSPSASAGAPHQRRRGGDAARPGRHPVTSAGTAGVLPIPHRLGGR